MLIVKNDDAVLAMWENLAPRKQNVYITIVVYTLNAAFSNDRHFSTAIKSTDTGGKPPHFEPWLWNLQQCGLGQLI